jgi:hypothetical protein
LLTEVRSFAGTASRAPSGHGTLLQPRKLSASLTLIAWHVYRLSGNESLASGYGYGYEYDEVSESATAIAKRGRLIGWLDCGCGCGCVASVQQPATSVLLLLKQIVAVRTISKTHASSKQGWDKLHHRPGPPTAKKRDGTTSEASKYITVIY